jgi:hypothetical protein
MFRRLAFRYQRFEDAHQLRSNSTPATAPVRGNGLCVPGCVKHRCEGSREFCRFTRGHKASACITHDLGNTANVRSDDGSTASKRLQHYVWATFHVTGQGDQVCCCHPNGNIVEGAGRYRMDVASGVIGPNSAFNQRSVGPLTNQIYMQVGALSDTVKLPLQPTREDLFSRPSARCRQLPPNADQPATCTSLQACPLRQRAERSHPLRTVRVFLRRSAHKDSFPAQSRRSVTTKSASRTTVRVSMAEMRSPMLLMSDPMLMTTRNGEALADLESGISIRIKKITEDEIGREAANVRQKARAAIRPLNGRETRGSAG